MTKPFNQYVFPALIGPDGKPKGYGVKVKDERAYAQALGHALDNPGISDYAIASHLHETSHPDVDHKVLAKRIGRYRNLPHWRRDTATLPKSEGCGLAPRNTKPRGYAVSATHINKSLLPAIPVQVDTMTIPEQRDPAAEQREPSSYTIDQFCAAERISRAMFYKLRHQGKAPRIFNVGTCVRISPEARRAWRAEREAEASAAKGSSVRAGGELAVVLHPIPARLDRPKYPIGVH
ncbi:MAG TPA: hypothetical protein VFJ49_05730 [Methyloceanibacter sp.]|nr:hypothetical protein [Methyloceanibacter sp.]